MKNYQLIITGIFLLVFSGCAKVQHLDQLLTLKAMADESDRLDKYVKAQDEKFEELISDIKNNALKKELSKKAVMKKYGDPIFEKAVARNGEESTMLLYRYAVKPVQSPKVYLYFNAKDRFMDWEYSEPDTDSVSEDPSPEEL